MVFGTEHNLCMTGMTIPIEAEVLTQEVFAKINRCLEDFRGESKLSTWLYHIATNIMAFNSVLRLSSTADRFSAYIVPLGPRAAVNVFDQCGSRTKSFRGVSEIYFVFTSPKSSNISLFGLILIQSSWIVNIGC